MKRYYFDYAAGTPMDSQVEKAMKPYWAKIYGNPGALHREALEAKSELEKATLRLEAYKLARKRRL